MNKLLQRKKNTESDISTSSVVDFYPDQHTRKTALTKHIDRAAVSYTHLDVYKRQVKEVTVSESASILFGSVIKYRVPYP